MWRFPCKTSNSIREESLVYTVDICSMQIQGVFLHLEVAAALMRGEYKGFFAFELPLVFSWWPKAKIYAWVAWGTVACSILLLSFRMLIQFCLMKTKVYIRSHALFGIFKKNLYANLSFTFFQCFPWLYCFWTFLCLLSHCSLFQSWSMP